MTQSDGIIGVKFGARRHMEEFAQGLLYMNTIRHFAEKETSSLRRDSYEGSSHMFPPGTGLSLQIAGEFTPLPVAGPIRYRPPDTPDVNVFCLYAVRDSASDTLVDTRNFEFGDTFAILIDFEEFMKRVQAAVPVTGQQLQFGPVEYIDEETYQAVKMGIFRKISGFSYQNEFRIALLPGIGTVRRFQIGNLSDIVMLGHSSNLNNRLRIQVNAGGQRELQIRND
jgi:hypothetical protein